MCASVFIRAYTSVYVHGFMFDFRLCLCVNKKWNPIITRKIFLVEFYLVDFVGIMLPEFWHFYLGDGKLKNSH